MKKIIAVALVFLIAGCSASGHVNIKDDKSDSRKREERKEEKKEEKKEHKDYDNRRDSDRKGGY
jgi:ribosomal protein L12E/L44/L45/RPP1/RPP2